MDGYIIKIAKGLANNADARLIRQQVFVEEQGFVNEFDDIDHEAYHAVIYTGAVSYTHLTLPTKLEV
mgnify:CR=1 FL=1